MGEKREHIAAAVGLPQLLFFHKAGKGQIGGRGFDGVPNGLGHQFQRRVAKPEKANLRQGASQLHKFHQPLAGDGMSHREDGLIRVRKAVSGPECLPPLDAGGKIIRVNAVAQGVNRLADAIFGNTPWE